MYRASLLGLFALFVCTSVARGQVAPDNGMQPAGYPPVEYVLSEQVTCTCGQVNENYAGGPAQCSGCGQPLPDPPTSEGVDVAGVQHQESPGFLDPSLYEQPNYEQPTYEQPVDYGYCPDNCGPACGQCRTSGNCGSLLHALSNMSCFHHGGCPPPLARNILQAPVMIGGGFGGSGMSNLQGSQTVTGTPLVAVGTGVINGANSSLLYDVPATVANPDFLSVGTGVQSNGLFTFSIVEAVAGTNLSLPPGATFLNATATEQVGGGIVNGELWDINVTGQQTFNILIPDAANAGAAVVGRSKIATNNSPLPRTRTFFNYDFMHDVRLNDGGVSVNRFTPGMEIAFGANDQASFEFRVPYASTLSSDIQLGGPTESGTSEFGDIFLAYKQLLYRSTDFVMSGGMSVTLPSTNDMTIRTANGATAVLIENRAVHLMPFLAGVANLTDRAFYQGFIQVDTDVTGNQVFSNQGLNTRIRDTTRMYVDGSLGYFLRRRGEKKDAIFDAIIPALGLHYESQLERSSVLTDGTFVLGDPNAGRQTNLNLVAGSTFEICAGHALSLGYNVPLGNRRDQMFDGQLRVIWNRYF